MSVIAFVDVDVEMLPKQIEVLQCYDKWLAIRGGVGASKTYSLCYWLWDRLETYPEAAHFVIGANYEMLRRGIFQTFTQILEGQGLEQGIDFTFRESPSPMVVLKHNGARLRSLSAQLLEKIRSTEIQTMVLEEVPTWHNGEAVWEVLSARLRHNPRTARLYPDMQPQGRMSFNPPPKSHWLFNLIEIRWIKEGYKCIRMSVRENVLMRGQAEYVHSLEVNLPESRWASEIDGHWKESGGGVYREFLRSVHCPAQRQAPAGLPPMAWDLSQPICMAQDFNWEWMATVLGQWHHQVIVTKGLRPVTPTTTVLQRIVGPAIEGWQEHIFYALKEIFLNNSGAPDVATAVIAEYRKITAAVPGAYGRVPIAIYGDPAGGGASHTMAAASSARTPWEQILQAFRSAGIPTIWRVRSKSPSILDRVARHNDQLRTGEGWGCLIDDAACPELVRDHELVEWSKKVVNTIDKSDKSDEGRKRTHLTDAEGYMFDVERLMAKGAKLEWKSFMGR